MNDHIAIGFANLHLILGTYIRIFNRNGISVQISQKFLIASLGFVLLSLPTLDLVQVSMLSGRFWLIS